MKKNKKIIFSLIVSIIALCTIFTSNVYGASVSLSTANTTVEVGDTIVVNINVSGAATWQITATSTGAIGETSKTFVRSDDGIDDVNKTIGTLTLKANNVGTGKIVLSGNSYSSSDSAVALGSPITINVKEKQQVSPTPAQPTNNTTTVATNKTTNTNTTTTTATKSSNAFLKTLQVNQEGLTPNFSKTKTNYAITVGENVDTLKVTATPEDSASKVSVSGNTGLKNGDNKIYVTVTAADGTKKVYTITVTKTGDPVKSNSYLQSLIVENATLSPEFSKENFEYDCGTVGASVENLKILAFGENENVKFEIIGNDTLAEGENTITVKVTSEDGTTTKEYKIKVIKDSTLVEENNFEEINALQDTNNDNKIIAFLKDVWNRVKANWLVVLMYIVILVEFIQIVYLYKRRDKTPKKNRKIKEASRATKEEVNKVLEENKNLTLDKEFKKNRKQRQREDNEIKPNTLNSTSTEKKRRGASNFSSEDK